MNCLKREDFYGKTFEIFDDVRKTLKYETITDMLVDLSSKYSGRTISKLTGISYTTVSSKINFLGIRFINKRATGVARGKDKRLRRNITMTELIKDNSLMEGVIENREYHGFLQDYKVLHYLIRRFKPKTFFEIGTHLGTGTKIIKNALGDNTTLYSLDLPADEGHKSKQYLNGQKTGVRCDLPYTQLFGDSLLFDFSKIENIEGFYIDAEHDFEHVYVETSKALSHNPKIIVYHDSDMIEVFDGILKASKEHNKTVDIKRGNVNHKFITEREYYLYRVQGTRIAFLVKDTEDSLV